MTKSRSIKYENKGSALLESLIFIGVISALISTMKLGNQNAQKDLQFRSRDAYKYIIRSFIIGSMNCGKTLESVQSICDVGDSIDIFGLDPANPVLISKNDPYTVLNEIYFRADCQICSDCYTSGAKSIHIEYKLNEKSDWFDLFEDGDFRCKPW